jgi:putative peptidoglycan lipid II flippase
LDHDGERVKAALERLRIIRFVLDAPAGRQIVSAMTTVAILNTLLVGSSTVRELLFAREFGVSGAVDALLFAYAVPVFVTGVLGVAFASGIVPTLVRIRESEGHDVAAALFTQLMALTLLLFAAVATLLLINFPLVVTLLASHFRPAEIALAVQLFRIMAPIVVLGGLNAQMSAVLAGVERFGAATAAPAITPIVVALTLALGHGRITIAGVGMSIVCGAAAESAALATALHRCRMWRRPRLEPHPEIAILSRQYGALVIGSLMMSLTTIIDQSMAMMMGPGAVSTLAYGNRVVSAAAGLAALAVGTAVMPYFSKMVAADDRAALRKSVTTFVVLLLAVMTPVAIALIVFAAPIVRLLFQRGQFTAADTMGVARVQQYLALEIPFYAAGIPLVRAISALRANHILTIGCAINLVTCVVLNYVFGRWIGVAGIALSTSAVYVVSFVFTLMMLRRLLMAPKKKRPSSFPEGLS